MPFESTFSNLGGGALLAAAIYAGASLWAGQLIGERSIERIGWQNSCTAGIKADLEATRRPQSSVPPATCSGTIGLLHPDLNALCRGLGDPDLNGPARRAEREFNRQRRELENRRLSAAAAKAGSMCACAENAYLSEELISLGIHAGTARLITPASVKRLEAELRQALAAPQCQALGVRQ
ncbi:MAG: hypothetical protein AAFY02_16225 [Pseudomonadota bacterium]